MARQNSSQRREAEPEGSPLPTKFQHVLGEKTRDGHILRYYDDREDFKKYERYMMVLKLPQYVRYTVITEPKTDKKGQKIERVTVVAGTRGILDLRIGQLQNPDLALVYPRLNPDLYPWLSTELNQQLFALLKTAQGVDKSLISASVEKQRSAKQEVLWGDSSQRQKFMVDIGCTLNLYEFWDSVNREQWSKAKASASQNVCEKGSSNGAERSSRSAKTRSSPAATSAEPRVMPQATSQPQAGQRPKPTPVHQTASKRSKDEPTPVPQTNKISAHPLDTYFKQKTGSDKKPLVDENGDKIGTFDLNAAEKLEWLWALIPSHDTYVLQKGEWVQGKRMPLQKGFLLKRKDTDPIYKGMHSVLSREKDVELNPVANISNQRKYYIHISQDTIDDFRKTLSGGDEKNEGNFNGSKGCTVNVSNFLIQKDNRDNYYRQLKEKYM